MAELTLGVAFGCASETDEALATFHIVLIEEGSGTAAFFCQLGMAVSKKVAFDFFISFSLTFNLNLN